MSDALGLALAAVAGAWAGWVLARRSTRVGRLAPGAGPHLLPDPALEWLRRAHGALGVWVAEHAPGEEGPRAERIVDSERLSVAQIVAVDRRLEAARDREQAGTERMDAGVLVFHAEGGTAVGLLAPPGASPPQLDAIGDDLRRLLDGVRRRPQIVALAQAQSQHGSLESVGSVGLRLAYQLERALDGQVVVAVVEQGREGDRSESRVRVVGVSGRADRRLLDAVLPEQSDLAHAALWGGDPVMVSGDPLAGVVADRRQQPSQAVVVPMRVGGVPVGAVAIWPPGGIEPSGGARAELLEALANAAPRLSRAMEARQLKAEASEDQLTGLLNRRAFLEALGRVGNREGALICADLDKFKTLNDTLGHPAGDAALLHFARILREQVRGGDIAARIGGEEFAVWLPSADLDLGGRIAERIRIKLGTTPWDWKGRSWPLSASFGVASCPGTSLSIENLPGQADAALYVAKRSGRNRVEKASEGGRAVGR